MKKEDKFLNKIKKDINDMEKGKTKHHEEKHKIHHVKSEEHKEHKTEMHQKKQHHAIHEQPASKREAEYSQRNSTTEKILIENFVALQKVISTLATSFDALSNRISKLLDLFEMSAKVLAEKDFESGKDMKLEKELNQKMDTLIEHNKIFARGLALLHEKSSGETTEHSEARIFPPINPQQQVQKRMELGENYQKSISSKP